MLLYGTHGIGKSTFGSRADSAVFIQTEDGLGEIECARFPIAQSYDEVMKAIAELYSDKHSFRTLVVDSVDWLERLIWTDVCNKRQVDSIEDIGYAIADAGLLAGTESLVVRSVAGQKYDRVIKQTLGGIPNAAFDEAPF